VALEVIGMRIYIVRHAWAHDQDSLRWPDDDVRPLTEEGIKRFRRVAKNLVERGFAPTRIATSPLFRCRQTADILLEFLPKSVERSVLDALAPGSDLKTLLAWTSRVPEVDVAWVGHAPDVGELTAALIGDGSASIRFAKGAVAAIRFEQAATSRGELEWFATAKILGC
jgi:phosphohistidine phosphatase